MTAIACDVCGKTETGTGYSGLMRRLRQAGWEKGQEKGTFFCDAPACRAARLLGRRWMGCEINPGYCALALKRIDVNRLSLLEMGL